MIYFAIDPGPERSAYVFWSTTAERPLLKFGYDTNMDIVNRMIDFDCARVNAFIIERVQCNGMPVGREVHLTSEWVGWFSCAAWVNSISRYYYHRPDVVKHFCGARNAKKSAVNCVLQDRFGKKGTKKSPGILYGVKDHIWDAVALVVMYMDLNP